MDEKIRIQLEDFAVVYEKADGLNVKIYVDGELIEERQPTWFLRVLLDEALRLKNR